MTRRSGLITLLMLLGLVLGALYGEYMLFRSSSGPIDADHWMGETGRLILIRPLFLLIVPLVLVSVTVGVASIGDPSRLGLLGGGTLFYYITTMAAAAALGSVLVTTFRPGELPPDVRDALKARAEADFAASPEGARIKAADEAGKSTLPGAWRDFIEQLIPSNIVKEMSEGRTLGIIVFAILLGLALAAGGEHTAPAVRVFEALNHAILRIVGWIIWLAPLGVFLLVASTVGRIGLEALGGPLGSFMIVVLTGLLIHAVVVLPIVLAVLSGTNPYRFMWRMRRPLLTAFGTASSNATLPVTMDTCVNEGRCSKRATNFVVPLGATVNMDGTALFEAVAVIFLCQLYGIELGIGEVLTVIVTATLAAVGAAGIPSAGLVTMVIVIGAVNVSFESRGQPTLPPSAMGVIIGVDRLLDMCRTVTNVWGDVVGAKIMTKLAPDTIEELEQARA